MEYPTVSIVQLPNFKEFKVDIVEVLPNLIGVLSTHVHMHMYTASDTAENGALTIYTKISAYVALEGCMGSASTVAHIMHIQMYTVFMHSTRL